MAGKEKLVKSAQNFIKHMKEVKTCEVYDVPYDFWAREVAAAKGLSAQEKGMEIVVQAMDKPQEKVIERRKKVRETVIFGGEIISDKQIYKLVEGKWVKANKVDAVLLKEQNNRE